MPFFIWFVHVQQGKNVIHSEVVHLHQKLMFVSDILSLSKLRFLIMAAVTNNPVFPSYTRDAFLPKRFYEHLKFAWFKHIYRGEAQSTEPIKQHFLEKVGNGLLWIHEEFPKKIWHGLKNPQVITIALTLAALYLQTLAFYPKVTRELTMRSLIWIKNAIPLYAVKFAAYIVSVAFTLGHSARALGRTRNTDLTNLFYNNALGRRPN